MKLDLSGFGNLNISSRLGSLGSSFILSQIIVFLSSSLLNTSFNFLNISIFLLKY
ncbi:MAG: DUF2929 family protein [Candidatus Heimdallarchaeota archaeon]|nr:DUF2929 family protein [Candidatus Heimdallarchaeota archaeon]